jgi:glutamyl-tRNA reductase
MVGVTWRNGGAESLAEFALPHEHAAERLRSFAQRLHLSELAYLATCNRVELLFARSPETPARDLRRHVFALLTGRAAATGEAERRLKAWQGEGAAEHLFLIAAGLDSACVGETEIVGQVRACHQRSLELGLCGPRLELVFEEALRIAARVRGETRLGQGRVSLAELAVELLAERVARTPGRIALLGVSPMTERAAVSLAATGTPLVIVNRTPAKAAALAAKFGAEHASLASFCSEPPAVEAVLTATGAEQPILTRNALERIAAKTPSGQAPLIIDMAVPADVEAACCEQLAIPRIGLDDIVQRAEGNRSARLVEAAQAREQVDEALAKLHDRITERYYGPLFGALQQRYRKTAQAGVKRLLDKELRGLDTAERAAVETWCEVLARRFAHIPCLGLRGLLHSGPEGSVEAFLGGLEPAFAEELRAALHGHVPPSSADALDVPAPSMPTGDATKKSAHGGSRARDADAASPPREPGAAPRDSSAGGRA